MFDTQHSRDGWWQLRGTGLGGGGLNCKVQVTPVDRWVVLRGTKLGGDGLNLKVQVTPVVSEGVLVGRHRR